MRISSSRGGATGWNLPVMAGLVPAIPTVRSAVLSMVGITGTTPVMTWRGGLCLELDAPP
jgi:hypothetical protein